MLPARAPVCSVGAGARDPEHIEARGLPMADTSDLSPDELAQALAEGLGIQPDTYRGRVSDAIIAMSLIKAYRRFSQAEREAALRAICDGMDFKTTNFMFWEGCRVAAAMIVANPPWVPASLTNQELKSEIKFWRGVSYVLEKLGFDGLPNYGFANAKGAFDAARKVLLDSNGGKPVAARAVAGAAWAFVKPNPLTGATVFGNVVRSIADSSTTDLGEEAARRGMTHEMTRLDASRYGSKP